MLAKETILNELKDLTTQGQVDYLTELKFWVEQRLEQIDFDIQCAREDEKLRRAP